MRGLAAAGAGVIRTSHRMRNERKVVQLLDGRARQNRQFVRAQHGQKVLGRIGVHNHVMVVMAVSELGQMVVRHRRRCGRGQQRHARGKKGARRAAAAAAVDAAAAAVDAAAVSGER